MVCNSKTGKRPNPDLADAKEIRKDNHVSLLAPSGSDTFSIASFLFAACIIDRRVSCTKLQFVKGDIGADISRNALVSRELLFPQIYLQIRISHALTVILHFHAADSPNSGSDPA